MRPQAERHLALRRNIAKVPALHIHLAGLHGAIVATLAVIVGHDRSDIIGCEIKRNLPVVHQQQAVVQIEAGNRQIEQFLHRSRAGMHLRFRRVRRPIGIHNEMHDGTLHAQVLEADSLLQERDDMQPNVDMVSMHIRLLAGSLQAVNGQIVGVELKLGKVPAKRAQLDSTAGSVFQSGNCLAPNQARELRASHVPNQSNSGRQQHHADCGLNPQAGVRTTDSGFFGHSQLEPEARSCSAGAFSAGIGTVL